MSAQPPGSCPIALWVNAHGQQVAPLVGGSYPSAEVQSVYSTAPTDRVEHQFSNILEYHLYISYYF